MGDDKFTERGGGVLNSPVREGPAGIEAMAEEEDAPHGVVVLAESPLLSNNHGAFEHRVFMGSPRNGSKRRRKVAQKRAYVRTCQVHSVR